MHRISHADVAIIGVMDKNDPKRRSMRIFHHSLFTLIITKTPNSHVLVQKLLAPMSIILAQDYARADFLPPLWSACLGSYKFNQAAKA